jgi:predicted phosphoadenosine phosphosulfate sulfurtransferase
MPLSPECSTSYWSIHSDRMHAQLASLSCVQGVRAAGAFAALCKHLQLLVWRNHGQSQHLAMHMLDLEALYRCVIRVQSLAFATRKVVCRLLLSLHCQQMHHSASKYPTTLDIQPGHPVRYIRLLPSTAITTCTRKAARYVAFD